MGRLFANIFSNRNITCEAHFLIRKFWTRNKYAPAVGRRGNMHNMAALLVSAVVISQLYDGSEYYNLCGLA